MECQPIQKPGPRRLRAVMSTFVVVLSFAAAPHASADSLAQAQRESRAAKAEARAAAAQVDALLDRYDTASAQVTDGVGQLSDAFSAAADADVTSAEAQQQEQRAKAVQQQQARDVYVSGGTAGLFATVLGAESPDDALWRASTADRVIGTVLADTRSTVEQRADDAALADRRAAIADEATTQQAEALDLLQDEQKEAATALTAAQQTLASLSAKAKKADVAVAAARRVAAAKAAADAAARAAAGPVSAVGIPPEYLTAYRTAAATCPGMSWTLLAAVGQVESGHGRNVGPSSAGAIGPMQFMPRTFAGYAVDGDGDGVTDAWDPEDAIFTAAHFLCTLGAEGGPADGIQRALLGYNHAQWYVDLVLAAQSSIAAANQP